MTVLLTLSGMALVVLVGVDVFRTVLMPSSSGALNHAMSRVLWQVARRVPNHVRAAAMRTSGPLSIVATVVLWLLGLLLGFALVYLPAVPDLAFAPDVRFGGSDFASAVYLSGASLLTIGFGDVVAQSTPLRLVTLIEGACGLGLVTATLGYLPAIYTLISELRTGNQAVADLGAEPPKGAAELLSVDASLVLDRVRRDVIAARQHLQRFPVLHYFHPAYDESVVALLRGATSLWVAGHFADDEGRPLHRHEKALEHALRRLTDDLVRHGGKPDENTPPLDGEALFAEARAASQHSQAAREGEVTTEAIDLVVRLHAVLDSYARRHDYPPADRGEV